jgi:enoyl-CoA hydratase/carnithine racemase
MTATPPGSRQFRTIEFGLDDEGVATVTLNRPQVLNSFNQAMLEDFGELWRRCRTDDAIRVIVLRANGERAFSTGVDRTQGRERHANPWSDEDPGVYLGAKQNRVWKPLICAVHGMVAGGAFYWLNEADVIICSTDATFFDPHTSYGMTSALEPVGMLRRVPMGEVLRIALFGLDERVTARRALEIGLVSEVVPEDKLRQRAQVLAGRLARKPPVAIQGTVKAIWQSLEMTAGGGRSIPYLYPQVGNPIAQQGFTPGERLPYELR